MFCCLCLRATNYCNDFYYSDGQPTDIYKISLLYFEHQFNSMDPSTKASQFLCNYCWKHIKEFHDFQKSIIEARKQLEDQILHPFEKILKSEIYIDFHLIEAVEENVNVREALALDTEKPFTERIQDSDELNNNLLIEANNKNKYRTNISKKVKTASINIRKSQRLTNKKQLTLSKGGTKIIPIFVGNNNNNETCKKPVKKLVNVNKKCKITNEKVDVSVEQKSKKKRMREMDEFIAEHWKDTFKCDKCDNFECNTFAEMRKHFRVNHSKMKAYVMCCENKFMRSSFFVDHLKWHMNPNIFQCNECGKSFMFRASYEFHKKCVHIEDTEKIECELCNKKFKLKSNLKRHMDTHAIGNKDYVCEHCNKGFVLKHLFETHVQKFHNDQSVCELCGKVIHYGLKQHLLEHQNVEKQKWSCDLCDAELNTKYSLIRHKRVAHHDGSTCYVCSECGKISMSLESLRGHKRYVHEKERNFKCNICDKAFKKPKVLREHMTTHTGQHLYRCPHCPQKFKVSSNMHHHRKRMHPVEWAANHRQRRNLPITSRTDINSIKINIQKEVVV